MRERIVGEKKETRRERNEDFPQIPRLARRPFVEQQEDTDEELEKQQRHVFDGRDECDPIEDA